MSSAVFADKPTPHVRYMSPQHTVFCTLTASSADAAVAEAATNPGSRGKFTLQYLGSAAGHGSCCNLSSLMATLGLDVS